MVTKDEIVEAIGNLKVFELVELVKELEARFGVTAQPPLQPIQTQPQAQVVVAEEPTEFSVVLMSFGEKKINVIKTVREITGLGLKEAKDFVEAAPKPIREHITKMEAGILKKKIEDEGGVVEIRPT